MASRLRARRTMKSAAAPPQRHETVNQARARKHGRIKHGRIVTLTTAARQPIAMQGAPAGAPCCTRGWQESGSGGFTLGEPRLGVVIDRGIGLVLGVALVGNRRSDRWNPDLAVTRVEIGCVEI